MASRMRVHNDRLAISSESFDPRFPDWWLTSRAPHHKVIKMNLHPFSVFVEINLVNKWRTLPGLFISPSSIGTPSMPFFLSVLIR
eukprot:scaffold26935_cov152-Cylindrotheca_fusiformis.AAC.2